MGNKTLLELRRALAHGTFYGAMRFAQGGKFEHGFLSGFVSSLGGSYIMGIENTGVQVVMSAVIGGTAESLGGGKFANGAVTGAYVMRFNHLMEDWPTSDQLKKDFGGSFEENVLDPFVYNENYVPSSAEELATDLLYSGILESNKHHFGLRPSGIKISIPIENNKTVFEYLPTFRPVGYFDSGLPKTTNPGIIPNRVLQIERQKTILFRFVIEYQIILTP